MKTALAFTFAGFIAGIVCTGMLFWPLKLAIFPAEMGFKWYAHILLLSFTSGLVTFAISELLEVFGKQRPIGVGQGTLVALLSFVSLLVLLSVATAGMHFLEVFPMFVLFSGPVF